METIPVSETELAKTVVVWLRDMEWEVYQEVQIGEGIADIVATRGPLIWVVEAKLHLSLKLLAQAHRWLQYAHYVSIAIPFVEAKRDKKGQLRGRSHLESWFVERILRDHGIGKFTVRPGCKWNAAYVEPSRQLDPKLHRRVDAEYVRSKLTDEQKTFCEAGSKGGGYWTPFKCTCEALREFVGKNPGCSLKAAIDGIKHHYASPASARGSLAHWIKAGKVPGLAITDGKVQLTTDNGAPR